MFKNLVVYRIKPEWQADLHDADRQAARQRFVPCMPSQILSIGWVEPRGEAHGPLIESIGGQWLMKLSIEKKVLPGAVVKREVNERMTKIEQETGERPGKKRAKELKEEVFQELLPKAFPTQSFVSVWIDPKAMLLVIDAGSVSRADVVAGYLVKTLEGFGHGLLRTKASTNVAMANWLLTGEAPRMFSVDRECELRSGGEDKSTVKYTHHTLDIEEVRQHVEQGKIPMKLAMTFNSRVSFVLAAGMAVKRVEFLDVVFQGGAGTGDEGDGFDANAAIMTGELSQLLPALIEALDGEIEPDFMDTAAEREDNTAPSEGRVTRPGEGADESANDGAGEDSAEPLRA